MRAERYDLVAPPPSVQRLDSASLRVHGIRPDDARLRGRPAREVLTSFLSAMREHRPAAIIGHDIGRDAALLVSEALRQGLPAHELRVPFRRLVCTKHLAQGRCGIQARGFISGPVKKQMPCWPNCVGLKIDGPKKKNLSPGGIPLPAHLRYAYPCDLLLNRMDAWPSPPRDNALKWPSLEECHRILVGPGMSHGCRHPPHDARGDVQRCRQVIGSLMGPSSHRPTPAPICRRTLVLIKGRSRKARVKTGNTSMGTTTCIWADGVRTRSRAHSSDRQAWRSCAVSRWNCGTGNKPLGTGGGERATPSSPAVLRHSPTKRSAQPAGSRGFRSVAGAGFGDGSAWGPPSRPGRKMKRESPECPARPSRCSCSDLRVW